MPTTTQTKKRCPAPARNLFKRICRLEHLWTEFPDALAELGLKLLSAEQLQQPHRIESKQHSELTQASSKLSRYYNPTKIQALAYIYAADFKRGSYSLDPRSIGLNRLIS